MIGRTLESAVYMTFKALTW